MVAIPTLLGLITTLVILSITIGPPSVIIGARKIPATLVIESAKVERMGKSYLVKVRVYNAGDEGLYIMRILANGRAVFKSQTYLNPRSDVRELSFIIKRTRGSKLNVSIVWAPETGSLRRNDVILNVPKK